MNRDAFLCLMKFVYTNDHTDALKSNVDVVDVLLGASKFLLDVLKQVFSSSGFF